jgi:DeoR/GlpR family transcriptional regulator of sugar metabolism
MIERVQHMLAQDRRVTLRLMAEELGISKDTVHTIIRKDLQMWQQSKNV